MVSYQYCGLSYQFNAIKNKKIRNTIVWKQWFGNCTKSSLQLLLVFKLEHYYIKQLSHHDTYNI